MSRLDSTELIQGKLLLQPPHYEKHEQLICALEGFISLKLVPHINRQELYVGQSKRGFDSDGNIVSLGGTKVGVNESPVNFFNFDYDIYPLLTEIEFRYTIVLKEGDCMYIPAYYFYSFLGN